jgi:mono-ADP-ribosyltransferase sirtuin 6
MPTLTKKYHGKGGKLVIINLQPTKQDKKADLIIKTFADSVLEKLFEKLGIDIPDYDPTRDPIVSVKSLEFLDWTQSGNETKRVVALASKIETEFKEKRKTNRKTKAKNGEDIEQRNGEVKVEKDSEVKSETKTEENEVKNEIEVKSEEIDLPSKRKTDETDDDKNCLTKVFKADNGS